MQEKFVTTQGYPEYSVSDLGRVRNDRTGRFLKPFKNSANGWYYVGLFREGKQFTIPVQRLVANAFMDTPSPPNTSILHRDGDRFNNEVFNLVWRPRGIVIMYMKEMKTDSYRYKSLIYSELYEEPVFYSLYSAAYELSYPPSLLHKWIFGTGEFVHPQYGYLASESKMRTYSRRKHGL